MVKSEDDAEAVAQAQQKVFDEADQQITQWGIEHNEMGCRADAYLYCTEVKCPSCSVLVPLSNTWVVGPTSKVIAELELDEANNRFDIHLIQNASSAQLKAAKEAATYQNSRVYCPKCGEDHSIINMRETKGVRPWEPHEFMPREDDLFQERLYAIRWVETYYDDKGKERTVRHFRAPDANDMQREQTVNELLSERFYEWSDKGFIPNKALKPKGAKTDEPIRTRGWTHWHQLFTPRQLLVHGLLSSLVPETKEGLVSVLGLGKIANWDSKLCQWGVGAARESIAQTFYNQALNTFLNFAGKGLTLLKGTLLLSPPATEHQMASNISTLDARQVCSENDL